MQFIWAYKSYTIQTLYCITRLKFTTNVRVISILVCTVGNRYIVIKNVVQNTLLN